jgi:hypothetical protein
MTTDGRTAAIWAPWPTLAASWLAFGQVLSVQGLVLWVIGGSVATGIATGLLGSAGRRALAVAAMLGLTVLIPWLADMLGGNTAGPITRAALMACAASGAMALMVRTRYPAVILLPSLVLLSGALGLGAASRVAWLAGLWVVCAIVTLAMVGPYRQEDLRERRRLVPFALMLTIPALVAVFAAALLTPLLDNPWTIPGGGAIAVPEISVPPSGQQAPSASPSASASITPVTPVDPPDVVPSPGEQGLEQASSEIIRWLIVAASLLLVLLLIAILTLIVWRAVISLRWVLLRRRLDSGTGRQRAIGAWTWLRLQRMRHDMPLPVSVSPDVALLWARSGQELDILRVASIVAPVAFDPDAEVTREAANAAWVSARAAAHVPSGTLRQRWLWSSRSPSWARARLATEPARSTSPVTG